jgi:CPA2 family monovalent cation:H+ antiporter-2
MLSTPFVIGAAGPVAQWIERVVGHVPLPMARASDEEMVKQLIDHVIIVGYGVNGRNLARVLKGAEIPYIILEQNGQVVRQARVNHREPILFGDATRAEVLEKVGIHHARAIVFAISAPAEERRGVGIARHLNPKVWIIVRTRYLKEMEELTRLGADQVVPEEFETSLEIFSRVLRLYGVPSNAIRREVESVRGEHYGMLRGQSLSTLKLDALRHLGVQVGMESIEVEEGSEAVGENPMTLALRTRTGCSVVASVRGTEVLYAPDREFRFRPGDLVVIVGNAEALEAGTAFFRKRSGERKGRVSGSLRVSAMYRSVDDKTT